MNKLRADKKTEDEVTDDSTTLTTVIAVLFVLGYLALNISGTVFYTKLQNKRPASVTQSLMDWNLASVILGWLMFPLLNLSSSITYAVSK